MSTRAVLHFIVNDGIAIYLHRDLVHAQINSLPIHGMASISGGKLYKCRSNGWTMNRCFTFEARCKGRCPTTERGQKSAQIFGEGFELPTAPGKHRRAPQQELRQEQLQKLNKLVACFTESRLRTPNSGVVSIVMTHQRHPAVQHRTFPNRKA